jgi:hypothetical protein
MTADPSQESNSLESKAEKVFVVVEVEPTNSSPQLKSEVSDQPQAPKAFLTGT